MSRYSNSSTHQTCQNYSFTTDKSDLSSLTFIVTAPLMRLSSCCGCRCCCWRCWWVNVDIGTIFFAYNTSHTHTHGLPIYHPQKATSSADRYFAFLVVAAAVDDAGGGELTGLTATGVSFWRVKNTKRPRCSVSATQAPCTMSWLTYLQSHSLKCCPIN